MWAFFAAVTASVETGSFIAGAFFALSGWHLIKWACKGLFVKADPSLPAVDVSTAPTNTSSQPPAANGTPAAPSASPWKGIPPPPGLADVPLTAEPTNFKVKTFG